MYTKGLLVIPAYNEEQTIGDVVREVKAVCSWDVAVVDDASTDRTSSEAKQAGAKVLRLPLQLGAWGATQTGIRYACRRHYPLVVTMDADGQHLGDELKNLIEPIQANTSDVVVGAHLARGSLGRLLAWRFFRSLTGLRVEDLTSGFRAYNSQALKVLQTKDATLLDYQDIGVLELIRAAGLRMTEIQVNMRPRSMGKSRIFSSWPAVFVNLLKTLILTVSKWEMSWLQRPNSAGKPV